MKLRRKLAAIVGTASILTSLAVGSGVLLINFNAGLENIEKRLNVLVDSIAASKDDQLSVALEKVQGQEVSLAYQEVDGTVTVLQDTAGSIDGPQMLKRSIDLGDGEKLIFAESQNSVYRSLTDSLWWTFALSILAALSSSLAVWFLMNRDLRLIVRLTKEAQDIAAGSRQEISTGRGSQELRELASSIAEMTSQLQDSKQHIQDFLSDSSHELRTPVTVIRGYLEILSKDPGLKSEQAKRAVERAQSSTLKMQNLIADLLKLAELGELPELIKEPVWLKDIYQELLDDLLLMQPNRKVTLTDSQSEVISASPELLRTFFSNAITNLIKHTPESAQVELSIKQHRESLEILIDDAGPGIPDLKKNGTQSKFKRFDASRSHSSDGSGLGLSIMQKIVELHGGRMVLSKSGLGGLRILGTLSKN